MTTLTDFLLARIAEDESVARTAILEIENGRWVPGAQPSTTDIEPLYVDPDGYGVHVAASPGRVLAECEAKRAIVGLYADAEDRTINADAWVIMKAVLAQLALLYADHADYDETWRP